MFGVGQEAHSSQSSKWVPSNLYCIPGNLFIAYCILHTCANWKTSTSTHYRVLRLCNCAPNILLLTASFPESPEFTLIHEHGHFSFFQSFGECSDPEEQRLISITWEKSFANKQSLRCDRSLTGKRLELYIWAGWGTGQFLTGSLVAQNRGREFSGLPETACQTEKEKDRVRRMLLISFWKAN